MNSRYFHTARRDLSIILSSFLRKKIRPVETEILQKQRTTNAIQKSVEGVSSSDDVQNTGGHETW
jgi:hypothetical protein